jgi:hypothetical protein
MLWARRVPSADLSFRENEEREAWATGGGGVLSVELRAVGLCRSLLGLRG